MKQTILFLRNGSLFANLEAAKTGLAGVSHVAGQPVVALYGTVNAVKLLFAIGTENGKYQIMASDADLSSLSSIVEGLGSALETHVDKLAGTDYGHVKTGGSLDFLNGEGTLKDNAVTTTKIANYAVDEDKIAINAITTDKIENYAVTKDKIEDANVTYAKLQKVLEANSVLGSKSANGIVTELSASDLFDILKTDSTNWNSIANSTIEIGTIVTNKGSIDADVFTSKGLTIKGEYTTATPTGIEVVAENDEVILKLGTASEALKANKLTKSRSIGLTGEVTGSASFDGSENCTITATIADGVSVSGWTLENSTATTQAKGDNSTKIATTAFVQAEIEDKLAAADALVFKGTVEKAVDLPSITNEMVGWTYKATKPFELNSQKVESGDMIICTGSAWSIIQTNIDGAVTGPASSTDGHLAIFDGITGKVIRDSGIVIGSVVTTDNGDDTRKGKIAYFNDGNSRIVSAASFTPSDIVLNIRKVTAGDGLTGGGALSGDVTISHPKSTNAITTDNNKGFLSDFTIDNYGHIVSLGTSAINVIEGTQEEGKYISSIVPTENGKGIEIIKSTLPTESGKVKVNSSDTADYLNQQIISHTTTEEEKLNNKYGVEVYTIGGALEMTVKIDTIDGGTY